MWYLFLWVFRPVHVPRQKQSFRLLLYVHKQTNEPIIQCNVILRAWFNRHLHYLVWKKTFVLGFVFVFVLAHALDIRKSVAQTMTQNCGHSTGHTIDHSSPSIIWWVPPFTCPIYLLNTEEIIPTNEVWRDFAFAVKYLVHLLYVY